LKYSPGNVFWLYKRGQSKGSIDTPLDMKNAIISNLEQARTHGAARAAMAGWV